MFFVKLINSLKQFADRECEVIIAKTPHDDLNKISMILNSLKFISAGVTYHITDLYGPRVCIFFLNHVIKTPISTFSRQPITDLCESQVLRDSFPIFIGT